jgi:uncharacterized protein YxjI
MPSSLTFPLQLSFKHFAMSPQFCVRDAQGQSVAYVKQKLFKLKEAITVFADDSQAQVRFHINADRVIDFSAQYNFTDAQGAVVGAVKQRGMRSLWKARFVVTEDGKPVFNINEKSMLTRFFDSFFSQIPLIGLLSGYLFQPAYEATRVDGPAVMVLTKMPALLEGRFEIAKSASLTEREEQQLLLSLMMLVLLERSRG